MTQINSKDDSTSADDVYPTGRVSNVMSAARPMILSVTFRFNAVLDPSKLHSALCTLLNTGDWRRFGGRLRKPVKGETLQIIKLHVPRPYTESRPPVAYSHLDHSGVLISEHELGKKLPEVSGKNAAVYGSAEDFREFAAAEDLPDTIDGYLVEGEDRPVLSLRITSFADATLVAVAVPHLIVDAMAIGELMSAWSLVVNGRLDEVPPVISAHEDLDYDVADPALVGTDESEKEPWALQSSYLTGFSFFLFVVRFLWDVMTGSKVENRVLYLPKATLDKMRAGAIDDIATHDSQQDNPKTVKPWVSEGDVLFAWTCRMVSLAQGTSPRPINALNTVNLRGRLPEITAPATGGAFTTGLATAAFMPVSPTEARGPLGLLAAKSRATLTTQATPTQILKTLRATRASVDAGKDAGLVCGAPPTGELFVLTNWIKADLGGVVDFSAAVVVKGDEEERRKLGKIVYLHSQAHARSATLRNAMGAVGKDGEGNVWLVGYFEPRTWDAMRRELGKMDS